MGKQIPRDASNDYSAEIIAERQRFIEETTGAELNHTKRYSFDPEEMAGNIEACSASPRCPSAWPARC
jgi:hydroxymethylglutaryl-CoA reductase (NADPH)